MWQGKGYYHVSVKMVYGPGDTKDSTGYEFFHNEEEYNAYIQKVTPSFVNRSMA